VGWAPLLLVVPGALVYLSAKRFHEVQDSTHRLLENMADTVDLRDPYTGGHSRRVAKHCAQILKEMKLGGPDAALILSAARVHDIGKIALPDTILNKPGLLTDEERVLMQTHPVRGAEVLARQKDFVRGVAIVLHHHEAWDGSGYPHGLKGVEIPFGARVIAVADSFDSITSDRPYRRGMSVAQAVDVLRQGRGQQWDPQVVDAFLLSIADQLESPQQPRLLVVPAMPEPSVPAVGA
jgi:HD-GYP domain-containing protein (c-di-GMP phosphodiesterase class II)